MRGELLKIPKLDRFTFDTHFLNSVHSQLTYTRIDPAKILEAQENLAARLNGIFDGEPHQIFRGSFSLSIGPTNTPAELNQPSKPEGLKFVGSNPRVELEIHADSLVYSEYEYSGFDDFQNRFKNVATVVKELLGVDIVKSASLRKINSIQIGSVNSLPEALSVFDQSMFGVIRSGIAETSSVQMYEGTLHLKKNDKACLFRYRIRQLDSSDKFEVILDFDLIDNAERTIAAVFSESMSELNDTSFDFFMWAVNKELTDIMGSGKNGGAS